MSRFVRTLAALLLIAGLSPSRVTDLTASPNWSAKLDSALRGHTSGRARSRIVIRALDADALRSAEQLAQELGGRTVRRLPLGRSVALDVPNDALPAIATSPLVERVSSDRVVSGAMERTGATVGATYVRQALGYDGGGIGVAVIDSGVAAWHDDLADDYGGQRVSAFVDF